MKGGIKEDSMFTFMKLLRQIDSMLMAVAAGGMVMASGERAAAIVKTPNSSGR